MSSIKLCICGKNKLELAELKFRIARRRLIFVVAVVTILLTVRLLMDGWQAFAIGVLYTLLVFAGALLGIFLFGFVRQLPTKHNLKCKVRRSLLEIIEWFGATVFR